MSLRLTPFSSLLLLITAGILLAFAMVGIAMEQRWLGMRLATEPDLVVSPGDFDGLWIDDVVENGPSRGVHPFQALIAIASQDGDSISIERLDLTEEPDTLGTYGAIRDFYERQSRLAAILRSPLVTVTTGPLVSEPVSFTIDPDNRRPWTNLPLPFWVQIAVGLAGFAIGSWILTLRRKDWAARMLFATGAGLMISAYPAAVYSTRELAIDGALFLVLSVFNHLGALLFGAGLIGLFLIYPIRLVSLRWAALPFVLLGSTFVADTMHVLGVLDSGLGPGEVFHLSIIVALAVIFTLVAIQYLRAKGNPTARAALLWFGLSIVVGAGTFVVAIIAPAALGTRQIMSQGEAFIFFLLVFVGVSLGVARYRLFQLDEWAFRILFYVLGVILLLVLDAILILTIVEDRAPAFALSLVLVAFLYLPLRDLLGRRFLRQQAPDRNDLFRQVMDVALSPPGKSQQYRWRALLERCFNPLRIDTVAAKAEAGLAEDGEALIVPSVKHLPALRLDHAHGGRRLFSPPDVTLASEMAAMLENAMESREAYEQGVATERARIARDIHDNIGVQLMGALHSTDYGRKDVLIRETLTDLRDIVNNASDPNLSFDTTIADLRMQISEHLSAAGHELDWKAETMAGPTKLTLQTAHTLRSVIREAVHNIVKHANARRVTVRISLDAGMLTIAVADDGAGFDTEAAARGNGLSNMRDRLNALKGSFSIDGTSQGTLVTARLPLTKNSGTK